MPGDRVTRRLGAAVAIVPLALALMSCQGEPPVERPTAAPTTAASSAAPSAMPTATPTPTRTPVVLQPDGSAADNLPYFDQVIRGYVDAYGRGERAILLEHLRAGGFDPAMIEAGWATTPNGLQESSIEAAVRFGEGCVIATVRDGRSTTAAMSVLSTGHCLIGDGFTQQG